MSHDRISRHEISFGFKMATGKNEIIDMRRALEAFGFTSSGGNSGHILYHTAVDNRTHASKNTANTI